MHLLVCVNYVEFKMHGATIKITCSVMNKRKVILVTGFDISGVQPPPIAAPENQARRSLTPSLLKLHIAREI